MRDPRLAIVIAAGIALLVAIICHSLAHAESGLASSYNNNPLDAEVAR